MTKVAFETNNYSEFSDVNTTVLSLGGKAQKRLDRFLIKEKNTELRAMVYEIACDESKALFTVYIQGAVDVDGQKLIIPEVLAHPLWNRSYNLLLDYSDSSLGHLQSQDIRNLSHHTTCYAKQLGMIKLALVMNSDINYGLGRMWHAYTAEQMDCNISIFRSYHEAESWLQASITEL